MTAAIKESFELYITDFSKCKSRRDFILRLTKTFSLDKGRVFKGDFWRALCERISAISDSSYKSHIRLVGLCDPYSSLPIECETLIRLIRNASESSSSLCAEAVIGDMKWKI